MPRKGKPRRTPRLPDRPEEFGNPQAALLPVGERTECRVGLEGVLVPIGAVALLQLPIASMRTGAVPFGGFASADGLLPLFCVIV